jgi:hypothetical protein
MKIEKLTIPTRSAEEVKKWEARLIDTVRRKGVTDFETGLHNSYLYLKYRSPCEEIGDLYATCKEREVILHCKIWHDHVEVMDMVRCGYENPWEQVLEEAAQYFVDFINDKILVTKHFKPNGEVGSTSWGKFRESDGPISKDDLDRIADKEGEEKKSYWVFSQKLPI